MKSFFLAMTVLPSLSLADFSQEEQFWQAIKLHQFCIADKLYTDICEYEVIDMKDYIRAQMLCMILRAKQGNIDVARWEMDRLLEQIEP